MAFPPCGQQPTCPERAIARFFWPGCEPRLVCARHRTAILEVASGLDLKLYVEPLTIGPYQLLPLGEVFGGQIGPEGPNNWYLLQERGKAIGYVSIHERRAHGFVARLNGFTVLEHPCPDCLPTGLCDACARRAAEGMR